MEPKQDWDKPSRLNFNPRALCPASGANWNKIREPKSWAAHLYSTVSCQPHGLFLRVWLCSLLALFSKDIKQKRGGRWKVVYLMLTSWWPGSREPIEKPVRKPRLLTVTLSIVAMWPNYLLHRRPWRLF